MEDNKNNNNDYSRLENLMNDQKLKKQISDIMTNEEKLDYLKNLIIEAEKKLYSDEKINKLKKGK